MTTNDYKKAVLYYFNKANAFKKMVPEHQGYFTKMQSELKDAGFKTSPNHESEFDLEFLFEKYYIRQKFKVAEQEHQFKTFCNIVVLKRMESANHDGSYTEEEILNLQYDPIHKFYLNVVVSGTKSRVESQFMPEMLATGILWELFKYLKIPSKDPAEVLEN